MVTDVMLSLLTAGDKVEIFEFLQGYGNALMSARDERKERKNVACSSCRSFVVFFVILSMLSKPSA